MTWISWSVDECKLSESWLSIRDLLFLSRKNMNLFPELHDVHLPTRSVSLSLRRSLRARPPSLQVHRLTEKKKLGKTRSISVQPSNVNVPTANVIDYDDQTSRWSIGRDGVRRWATAASSCRRRAGRTGRTSAASSCCGSRGAAPCKSASTGSTTRTRPAKRATSAASTRPSVAFSFSLFSFFNLWPTKSTVSIRLFSFFFFIVPYRNFSTCNFRSPCQGLVYSFY